MLDYIDTRQGTNSKYIFKRQHVTRYSGSVWHESFCSPKQ